MKIFRGPSTQPFEDGSHELVSNIDIEQSGTFVNDSVVLVANITKDPTERQAIAHLELSAGDLLALHQRMLTGLASKIKRLEQLETQVSQSSKALYALWESLTDPEDYWDQADKLAHLESHISNVRDVVGELANRLEKF